MGMKNLRYTLSLSALPSNFSSIARKIIEASSGSPTTVERFFLNSILLFGYSHRPTKSNYLTNSCLKNIEESRSHQFSMPMNDENKSFINHILSFKQGKSRTGEYNYLLFIGINAFLDNCKKLRFCEKYGLIQLMRETQENLYLSGLYPFYLEYSDQVSLNLNEEGYFLQVYKQALNDELLSKNQAEKFHNSHNLETAPKIVPSLDISNHSEIKQEKLNKTEEQVQDTKQTLDSVSNTPSESNFETINANPFWNDFKI
ncbi:TPA: hypothetical protein ACGIK9_003443 [Acinetobacter baumannii]|uniref:hypothetical protein n=1 Tax=Acinetobacter baumannii TaxID=470 RepID=UPI00338E6613